MSTDEETPTNKELLDLLQTIYSNLLENQVDLDPEAKQILYKNLWDLYVRS